MSWRDEDELATSAVDYLDHLIREGHTGSGRANVANARLSLVIDRGDFILK